MLRLLPLTLLGIATASLAADSLMDQLAGRYTERSRNGNVDGDVYYTTDVVEILPIGGGRAVITLDLNFFNGHSCTLGGVASLRGGRLVYRDPKPNPWSEGGCQLEIWRERGKLRWTEGAGTSCQSSCGARGGLSVGDIPYTSRRRIGPARARLLRENPDELIEP